MRYTRLTAALAAAIALAASAPAAHAQKALVYCPVTIDAGGCDRIVSALKTKFDSVDRGFDGSSGTLDLKKIDLQHYGVIVVPSLADDANKQPYALLRSVAPRLHMAINGRVAVYSGAPDQGAANRDSKDAVIQNLARWAANGHTHTAGLVGLVAFLDLSEKTTDRYSWVRSISLIDVSADEELQAFGDITPMTSRGGDMFTAAGKPVRFSNMASYGLHIGAQGAARTEVSASGGVASRQSVLIQYSNADGASESASAPATGRVGATGASFSLSGTSGKLSASTSATTSGPTIATDKPDYSPGDTVTFTGSGWTVGDSVTITIHEDPHWTQEDRTVIAVVDGSGNFRNHTFVVDQRDFHVTFTATAVANPSGLVAQLTFTDGSSTVSGTVTDAITHLPIGGATVLCPDALTLNPCNNLATTTTVSSGPNIGTYSLTVNSKGNNNAATIVAFATGYSRDSSEVTVSNATAPNHNFALTPVGPTKLAFVTAAIVGVVNECIGPISIQTQNASSTATNVTAATTVNLTTDQGGTGGVASFYAANTCAAPITSIVIATGNNSGTFFYRSTARATGAHILTVAATGLTSASQTETINKADQAALTVTAPTAGIFGDKLLPAATGGSGTGALTFATVTTPASTACSIIASGGDAGKLQITSGTGVCAITATKAADNDFNSSTSAAQTVTVSKATPVFSALASQIITYGTATQAFTGKLATASGLLIPTGTVTVTLGTGGAATSLTPTLAADGSFTATFNTAALNASTTPYPLAYSFTTDNNFLAASDNTTTLTVNKANQTITFAALTDKIYGDADFAVSATATSGLGVTFTAGATDKCTVTGTTVHITGAGSCTITAAQVGDGNYNAATAAVSSALARTFTIAPKALAITAKDANKIYGQVATLPGTDFTSSGLVGTETIGTVTLTSTGTPATATVTGSPYPIVASAATGGTFTATNYTITYTSGSLTVTPKALTVTASNRAKAYGDAVTFAGTEFTTPAGALINGDVINSVTLASPGAAATATVAGSPYAITASAAAGTGLGNYTVSYTAGTMTVNAKALTITAKDANKTYGDVAVLTGTTDFTSSGLVNGDAVSSVTLTSTGAAATAGVTGSPYAIVASAAVSTALANYTVSYVDGKLTVNKKALTITANPANKTYGTALTFGGTEFTSAGLANSETVGSVTLTSTGAAAGATVAGSPYPIVATAATGGTFSAANYTVSYVDGVLTVNAKALTVTANNHGKTYGDVVTFTGSEFSVPPGALVGTDAITSVTLTSAGAAAGASVLGSPYAITASAAVGSGLANYTISYTAGSLTVGAKALTITANSTSKTYGQTATFNGTEFTPSGLVNSETVGSVTLSSPGAAATATVAGSPYTITASAATGGTFTASNYSVSYATGTLTVTAKALSITANNRTKTYGDAITFTGTEFSTPAGALVNGDAVGTVTLTSAGAAATAVVSGSPYPIVATAAVGTGLGNYSITYNDGSLTVSPKALTITAKDETKTYGDVTVLSGTMDFTASGIVNSDAVTSVTLTSSGTAATAGVGGSPYPIIASAAVGSGLTNYTISYVDGKLTVKKKALTITANNRTKTYGEAVTFAGTEFTPNGLVNGETVTSVTLSSLGAAVTATVAGSPYAIVASAATGGTFSPTNYYITYADGSLTVDRRALSITAKNAAKTYGQTASFGAMDFNTSGLVNSDAVAAVSLTSTGAAPTASVAGSPYPIVPSAATGTGLGNYTISYLNGSLTVNAKALTITANNRNKIYGDVVTFGGTEFTPSGLENSETVGSVTLSSAGAAATATVAGSPYAITASAATGGTFTATNYAITYAAGSLTVNAKPLAITANDRSKTYGDVVTFAGTEFSTPAGGLVNGDAVSGVTFTSPGAAATATVAGSKYPIVATAAVGTGLGNYSISYTDGKLTVDPKALTITAKDANKTYGDVAVLSGTTDFSTNGIVNSDVVTSVTLTSAGTPATAGVVGSPYAIVASAAVGTGLANYTISYVDGKLTVKKKALTITASSTSKTYGQTVTFTGTEFTPNGLVNSETVGSVTLSSTGAAATATVAGSPYAIVASAATGGTFSPGNYYVTYADGSLTVNTKPLTITANDRAKTYGDVVTFVGTEFTTPAGALINGDAVASVTLTSAGAAATATVVPGSPYAIVASAAGGTGLSNYSISYTDGKLTVNPKALTITAKNASKTYGQTAALPGTDFTSSGLVNTDAVSSVTLTSTGSGPTANVAGSPYLIIPSAAAGTGLGNYAISYVNGSLTVGQKSLTITANNRQKTYGDAVTFAGSEFTPYGLVNGESVGSVSLSSLGAPATAVVSSYAIVPSNPTGGTFRAGNYAITYTNGSLTVNPKALSITANSVSKDYGDPLTFAGTEFTSSGLTNSDAVTSVTLTSAGAASTALASPPTYPIVATAAVGTGLTNYTITYNDGTLTINNHAPVLVSVAGPGGPVALGSPVKVTGNFTDHGVTGDHYIVSSTWTSGGSTLSVPTTDAATYNGNSGTLIITAPVSIPTGVYTVSIKVTDRFGAASNVLTIDQYVVVYDPSGGFVTGGGWINSPSDACHLTTGCNGVTGKANFGFVSKYQKGANVPDGNTEFQFQAGNLNFKSTAYEWLVIGGARAQYKGTGTINGSGNYGFMLTAIDGSINGSGGSDRFRIKIWDVSNPTVMLYDNQIGTTDDATLMTAGTLLGGGSISIKAK